MSLRHTLLFTALSATLSGSPALHAADEFTNGLIPSELVSEIAGYQNPRFFSSLPDDFPLPASLPPGLQLRLLGSLQHGTQQRLFLRSPRSAGVLLADLRQAYLDAGWVDVSIGPNPGRITRLCHDEQGELQINSPRASNGTTSIEAYHYKRVGIGLDCSNQSTQSEFRDAMQTRSDTLFPILEVPEQTLDNVPPYPMGLLPRAQSYSGNSDGFSIELERKGIIEVPDMALADIYEHFAQQLREQGWERDSGSVGLRSTSTVWYRPDAADTFSDLSSQDVTTYGNFIVIDTGEGRYRVSFAMSVEGGSGSGGAGIIGIRTGF